MACPFRKPVPLCVTSVGPSILEHAADISKAGTRVAEAEISGERAQGVS